MPARPNIPALFSDEGWLLIHFKVSASLEHLFKNHLRSPLVLSDGFLCSPGRAPPHTLSSPTHTLPSDVTVCHAAQHHTVILPWVGLDRYRASLSALTHQSPHRRKEAAWWWRWKMVTMDGWDTNGQPGEGDPPPTSSSLRRGEVKKREREA